MKHFTIPTDSFLDGRRFPATTLRLALIYAAAELLISSPIWLTIGDNPLKPFLGKLVLEAVFVVLAILFTLLLSRMRKHRYATQIFVCLLLSLISSLGMSLLDYYLYTVIMSPAVVPFNIMDYGYAVCYRMSIFFGWSFLFVALLNHMDIRDRDLKLIASREEALAAQTLNLSVENDVAASVSGRAGEGLGIGLANVAHRVRTHFPEAASLTAGHVGPTRYRVSLHMPFRIGQGEA